MDLAEVTWLGMLTLLESSIFPIDYKRSSKINENQYQNGAHLGSRSNLFWARPEDLTFSFSMVIFTLSFMNSSTNYYLLMCPSPLTSISQKMLRMEVWDSLPSRNLAIYS